jgi:uncharacterized protein (TIGR02453 family)
MFTGFPRDGLRFLDELARNNERAWFLERKERFERTLAEPMRAFVADTSNALHAARIPIGGNARRSIFRFYRDVRFSPDKRPYNTHLAAYLSYDGERTTQGGLYVHVAPRASRLAIAFYRIERPMLQRWRASMAHTPARFRRVLASLERNGLVLAGPDGSEDALTRMPRGFERYAESPLAPYFRLRHFVVRRPLSASEVASPRLVAQSVEFVRSAKALLDFGWSLI